MRWTRRQWTVAAASAALPLQVAAQSPAQPAVATSVVAPLGPPPQLPDKASFPFITGADMNGASTHPRPIGAVDHIKLAQAAEVARSRGNRSVNTDGIRKSFARMINADPTEVVMVPSTQFGESLVGAALGVQDKGSHIVSDHLHFIGSTQMYTDMAKRGTDVTWVKMADNGISLDAIDKAIVKGKTKLVALSATSFINGFQHDVKRVCEIAHAKGAMVYADIIQAVGNSPVDVKEWGVDAACAASYKWLMSAGTAFLYVRKESLARMRPPFYHFSRYTRLLPDTHMFPYDTPSDEIVDNYEPKEGAAGLFSIGYEPNTASVAGLEYTLAYIQNIGVDKIQGHVQPLITQLKQEMPKRGYPLLTPLGTKSPIVSFIARNADALAVPLRSANVTVTTRWNHIRVSPSVFNDREDVERLLAAMPRV